MIGSLYRDITPMLTTPSVQYRIYARRDLDPQGHYFTRLVWPVGFTNVLERAALLWDALWQFDHHIPQSVALVLELFATRVHLPKNETPDLTSVSFTRLSKGIFVSIAPICEQAKLFPVLC